MFYLYDKILESFKNNIDMYAYMERDRKKLENF